MTGTARYGIYARNNSTGTDLTVTTGQYSDTAGGNRGIFARNYGTGALEITANGKVTGTARYGIFALNYGTDLTITTGQYSDITGGQQGIYASNKGTGALEITANGRVTGTSRYGIYARNAGTDLTITTGQNSDITGRLRIFARNKGVGALEVTVDGAVKGTAAYGIFAINSATGADLTITTGQYSDITGDLGIVTRNYGAGAQEITANGKVTGTGSYGIFAVNMLNAGTDLTVTTGQYSDITGSRRGIIAYNLGSGALEITANGAVTGTASFGIDARNTSSGIDLTITTGQYSDITGGTRGIRARNYGGVLEITANGKVTGTAGYGIYARNASTGTDLTITTGQYSDITGGYYGVFAKNFGANGAWKSPSTEWWPAAPMPASMPTMRFTSAELTVTTGQQSDITGGYDGIFAVSIGAGLQSLPTVR